MNFLILTISLLIFLFTLYKLAKDDHVFLRKNIRLEEFFDCAMVVIICGLILQQFSFSTNFSLTLLVLGGSISIYALCNYKNFPFGRIYDYFAISFLCTLPSVFLLRSFFVKNEELILYIGISLVYALLAIFFIKNLLAKVMSKSIKEGRIGILFILLYSSISILINVFYLLQNKSEIINFDNIALVLLFTFGFVLLIIQNGRRSRR